MAHEDNHADDGYTVKNYIIGLVLAIILTLLSFVPVMKDMLHNWSLSAKIIYLLGLAFLQISVQSFYFLHLHHGEDSDWKLGTYAFGLCAATIVVGGSWWAIQHLNYNMMGGSGRIVTPSVVPTQPAEIQKIIENAPSVVVVPQNTAPIQVQTK